MFKQLSNRVSAKTIEETYTDLDVEHVKDADGKDTTDISLNYNPNTGFTFDYPQRWLNEENEFKAIGIRRLKVIPTSHIFALLVRVEYMLLGSSEAYETNKIRVPLTITTENTTEEIIHFIINALNEHIQNIRCYTHDGIEKKESDYHLGEIAAFTYTFDYRTGNLSLKLVDTSSTNMFYDLVFKIEGDTFNDDLAVNNLNYFLKFLNQERTDENRNILTDYSETKTFSKVWDRVSLQFHASFSNNKRNFIGLNNDFYDNPSVFYDPPTNASDFWIKFTTDGRNQFLPRYCRFYVGISFVRNYKNSLVTK